MSTPKLDPSKLWVELVSLNMNGFWQFTCFSHEVSEPVGMAWVQRFGPSDNPGNSKLARTFLIEIFTVEKYRRCGVARAIHKALFDDKADCVITQQGTKVGGLALIKALGYKREPRSGLWVLTKAAFARIHRH